MVVNGVENKKSSSTSILTKSLVGVFSQGLTWPLEYAKTIKQFNGFGNKNILSVVRYDINQNGLSVMYRGLTPQVVASVPRFVTRFSVYETLNKINKNNNEVMKFGSGLVAGGVEAALVMTPAETIKVQMIKNKIGAVPTIRNIYNANGIYGFWKGGSSTISRQGTTQGISLYINSMINPIISPYFGMYTGLVSGMIGGTSAVMVNNPIDVIKTRQQENLNKVTIRNEIIKIWKNEGFVGFYRGALIRSIRVAPLHGFTYFFYDVFSKI